jgi:hypothetical protein
MHCEGFPGGLKSAKQLWPFELNLASQVEKLVGSKIHFSMEKIQW